MNQKQYRVLVSISSRWLGEMMRWALGKASELELAAEMPDARSLDDAVVASHPDWLIVGAPDHVDALLHRHPDLRILVISEDATTARVVREGAPTEQIDDLSLAHIVARLTTAGTAKPSSLV